MSKGIILVLAISAVALLLVTMGDDAKTVPSANQNIENAANDASAAEPAPAKTGTVLDLRNSNLQQVPASVFANPAITELNLSGNNLTGALPAEVRHLRELRVLNLAHNGFTGVPAEVGQLTKLEVLDLSHNSLTGLPYELGNLGNLQILDLRGNNYAAADLEVIKQGLSPEVEIYTD